jgi:hypothetical protein
MALLVKNSLAIMNLGVTFLATLHVLVILHFTIPTLFLIMPPDLMKINNKKVSLGSFLKQF